MAEKSWPNSGGEELNTGKRVARGAAGVVTVALLLAGCGGSDGDGKGGQKPDSKDRRTTEGAAPREDRAPLVAVPAAFDATKGWAVRTSEGLSSPVYAPHAKAVLFLKTAQDGKSTQVVARDLRTGAVRWTGEPVALPESGAHGRVDGYTSLMVTSKDQTDYAVVKFQGVKGGDGVSKPRDTTQLTVFPARGTGSVQASGTFEFPYKNRSFTAQDTGGVVHNSAGLRDKDAQPLSVDVTTGTQTTYTKQHLAAPRRAEGCDERRIVGQGDCDERAGLFGVSPGGPLASDGHSSFWLGAGGWYSGNNKPADATQTLGFGLVVPHYRGGVIVAQWMSSHNGAARRTEIRDPATGQVRASVRCVETPLKIDTGAPAPNLAGDRYVWTGSVVMDLRENKGYCFEENDDRKRVTIKSVDAGAGLAYGVVASDRSGPRLPVEVDFAADKVTPLGRAVQTPSWVAEGVAAYVPEGDDTAWLGEYTAGFYPPK